METIVAILLRKRMFDAAKWFIRLMIGLIIGVFLLMTVVIGALFGWLLPEGKFSPHNQTPTMNILPPNRFIPLYVVAGNRYDIPWPFLATINRIETDYNQTALVSSAGALGPMQFMPQTWKEYGQGSPFQFTNAVFATSKMFSALGMKNTAQKTTAYWIARFAGAYNAGPGNWNNSSLQTVAYRWKAQIDYALIESSVHIPSALMAYWNAQPLSAIRAMTNGQKSIYPAHYHGSKVVTKTNIGGEHHGTSTRTAQSG